MNQSWLLVLPWIAASGHTRGSAHIVLHAAGIGAPVFARRSGPLEAAAVSQPAKVPLKSTRRPAVKQSFRL